MYLRSNRRVLVMETDGLHSSIEVQSTRPASTASQQIGILRMSIEDIGFILVGILSGIF